MTTTRRSLAAAVAVLGCLLWSGPARADARSPEVRSRVSPRVDAWVERRMAAHATPGAAVAVVRDGRVVHLAGYGHADPDGTPVTPDTAFLIGSVSKPITAALVEQLVADGVLDWDEPVWPHLAHLAEQAPDGFEAATVEQLLTHTAGLSMSVGVAGAVEVHDGPDALDQRARDVLSSRLASAPGTRWEYSNAGPTVLAAVIERVTARSFGDELRDRVFDPLGMTGSFATAERAAAAPLATGHALWFGRWRPVEHPYDEAGTAMGYIGSTAKDLAAFMQAYLDGHPAIPADASQLADGPVHVTGWDVPLEGGYGRGWFVDELAGHAVVGHTGSLGHFTAHILLVPTAGDLGIAVLTNASAIIAAGHEGQYDLGLGLVRILLGEQPRPASRRFVLTYAAPALAWAACALLVAVIARALLDLRRAPHGRPRARRGTQRRLAFAAALLAVGVALLVAPLDAARHFYPDAGWGLSLLAPLSLVGGLINLVPRRSGSRKPGSPGGHPFGITATEHTTFAGLTDTSAGRVGWYHGTDRWAEGKFFRYRLIYLEPIRRMTRTAGQGWLQSQRRDARNALLRW
jgi:CubicO group peptidase (beta-lactamase class C family)